MHLRQTFATVELVVDGDDTAGEGPNENADSVTSTPLKSGGNY